MLKRISSHLLQIILGAVGRAAEIVPDREQQLVLTERQRSISCGAPICEDLGNNVVPFTSRSSPSARRRLSRNSATPPHAEPIKVRAAAAPQTLSVNQSL